LIWFIFYAYGDVAMSAILTEWLDLNTKEGELKKQVKDLESALDAKALAQYAKLFEAEVKSH
jgi:hypothetical protein